MVIYYLRGVYKKRAILATVAMTSGESVIGLAADMENDFEKESPEVTGWGKKAEAQTQNGKKNVSAERTQMITMISR